LSDVWDVTSVIETDTTGTALVQDGGLWVDGDYTGSAYLEASGANSAATNDGLHPYTIVTSPERGGVYILRDYVIAKLNALKVTG